MKMKYHGTILLKSSSGKGWLSLITIITANIRMSTFQVETLFFLLRGGVAARTWIIISSQGELWENTKTSSFFALLQGGVLLIRGSLKTLSPPMGRRGSFLFPSPRFFGFFRNFGKLRCTRAQKQVSLRRPPSSTTWDPLSRICCRIGLASLWWMLMAVSCHSSLSRPDRSSSFQACTPPGFRRGERHTNKVPRALKRTCMCRLF